MKAAWGLVALAALAYSCGSSDDSNADRDADAGAGGEPAQTVAGAPNRGGSGGDPNPTAAGQPGEGGTASEPSEAGAAGQTTSPGGAAGAAGAGPVELPDGGIVDVPYVCESPFEGVVFDDYFYLEDFEDAALDQPGVTAPNTVS